MHRTETENAWSAVTLLVCLLLAAVRIGTGGE